MNIVIINIKNIDECLNFIGYNQNYIIHFLYYGRDKYPLDPILQLKQLTNTKLFELPLNHTHIHNYQLLNCGKWKNIYHLITNRLSFTNPQECYFFFPDPDIQININDINQLFSIARYNNLEISQPSLSHISKCSHPFLKNKGTGLRQEKFCEIMMPLFSYNALLKNIWTFNLTYSGYGIDYIWGLNNKCTIIDSIQAIHKENPHYEYTSSQWGFSSPTQELLMIINYYLPPNYK